MAREVFEVTKDRFHLNDSCCYILQGTWPKEAKMRACLDGSEVKTAIQRLEVVSALERFKDPDLMRGERITATVTLPESLEGYHKLTVYADMPDKTISWFTVSIKDLEKRRGKPQFYIEEEKVQQGFLRIRGWAVAKEPVRIQIFDENKNKIQAEILRTERVDVEQLYEEMDNKDKSGFFVELTNLKGKILYMVFYAGNTKSVHIVHLQRAVVLSKKIEKYAKKGLKYWKNQGSAALVDKMVSKVKTASTREIPYQKWIVRHLPGSKELERQRREKFEYQPKISIVVPLYKTPEKYLRQLVDTVKEQTYPNWELCLSDGSGENSPLTSFLKKLEAEDERIRVVYNEKQLQISENTNAGIEIATGDYIAFADHDDELTPHALFECVKALNKNRDIRLLYSDEDKMSMDGHKFFQPHFKPDYNPDLLCTVNYICHLFVVKREIIDKVGVFRSEFDGAQDYDFIFRCVEAVDPSEIYHITKILYHWRCHEDSTAENPESKTYAFEAGKRAIEEHYRRTGINAEVLQGEFLGLYRTRFIRDHDPLISIIIPNKDHIDDLKRCMDSIDQKSIYKNYEYIIVENNSTDEKTFQYYKELEAQNPKAHIVYWDREFNYSAINNYGVSFAKGEYILLLNNDTEIINEDCLEQLLGYCMRNDVGAVGARMYYEDDTIQHAGVVIGFGGIAGHCFVLQPRGTTGYCHRIICAQDYSAVTAACMLVKKSAFDEVGGLTEELAVAFNDIDFCMKLRQAGYLIVYNPYAELYHYESKSRGLEDTPEKVARFNKEMQIFERRWPDIMRDGDPYYNPNLTLKSQDFSLRRI
ncbi:glycosyltransferase family 2 protein [Blautia sp. HCP28S3_G10]|uniref:glycosyltransferase family 2 protein n=1 Tax=Blautia sp. HCP28S3_G10 TaxID=3438908 RepID=UPI003F8C8E24